MGPINDLGSPALSMIPGRQQSSAPLVSLGILARSEPETGRLHQKCGRIDLESVSINKTAVRLVAGRSTA